VVDPYADAEGRDFLPAEMWKLCDDCLKTADFPQDWMKKKTGRAYQSSGGGAFGRST